jgi:hypothetical protein
MIWTSVYSSCCAKCVQGWRDEKEFLSSTSLTSSGRNMIETDMICAYCEFYVLTWCRCITVLSLCAVVSMNKSQMSHHLIVRGWPICMYSCQPFSLFSFFWGGGDASFVISFQFSITVSTAFVFSDDRWSKSIGPALCTPCVVLAHRFCLSTSIHFYITHISNFGHIIQIFLPCIYDAVLVYILVSMCILEMHRWPHLL